MAASAPPLVIDVARISKANNWTYLLIFFNILVWTIFIFALFPMIKIFPSTGGVLHEFIATVINN
jgi:hypothetical protein